jgi:hypothetical protein
MTNADLPWRAVRKWAERADISTKIDETVLNAHRRTYPSRTIHGVFLPNAAKVELHTGNLECQPGSTPSDFIQTDPRQQFGNCVATW